MPTPTEIQRRLDSLKKRLDEGKVSKEQYTEQVRAYVRGLPEGDWARYASSDVYARKNTSSAAEASVAAVAGLAGAGLTAPGTAAGLYRASNVGPTLKGDAAVRATSSAARSGLGAARSVGRAAAKNPIPSAIGGSLAASGLIASSSGDTPGGGGAFTPSWASAPLTQGFGPTDTKLDGPYGGYTNFNKGLDFGVPVGTPIDAAVAGTVVSAGDSNDGWGVSVKIRDAEGNIHNYGHLNAAGVKVGQQVAAGDIIGESGNTGKSTGPHLSYDVLTPDGQYVDPSAFVGGSPSRYSSVEFGAVSNPASQALADVSSIVEMTLGMAPNRADYEPGPTGQAEFQAEWAAYQELLMGSIQIQNSLRLSEAGLMEMPDGKILGIEDALTSQDPAIRQWAENHQREVQMGYTQLMDELNLGQFNAYNSAVSAENSRVNSQFTQKMDRFNAGLDYDRANIDRAVNEVNRMLSGQEESRLRAQETTDAQMEAAPWASGGKTEFLLGDLGSGVDTLARQAGIRPGQPLLSFPGTMRIDPAAQMTAEDVNRGVAGALPLIPGLTTNPSQIPGVPNTTPINTNVPQSALLPLLQQAMSQMRGGGLPLLSSPNPQFAARGGSR